VFIENHTELEKWRPTRSVLFDLFLADRTNGRASATVLCLSVVCLSVTYVLWLNGASYRKTVSISLGNGL